jgi:hypothetical protein
MSAHPPPVPPANQSTKGPGDPKASTAGKQHDIHPSKAANTDEQGDHANVKQNTQHPAARGDR